VVPKGIPDDEFLLFVEQCKRSGLDPLLKEAYCVARKVNLGSRERPQWGTKYEFQPSEAGMLARAERFPDYQGVQASAVWSEDEIAIHTGRGEVQHSFNPAKRKGRIVGAWARVQRRDKVPVLVWLDFEGYAQQSPLWGKIPATMMEKCARVAALRKAYPEAFGGLYIREEMPADADDVVVEAPALPPPAPALPANTKLAALPDSLLKRHLDDAYGKSLRLSGEAQVEVEKELAALRKEERRRLEKGEQELAVEIAGRVERERAEVHRKAAAAQGNPKAGFGPCKGRFIHSLSFEELVSSIELGRTKLRGGGLTPTQRTNVELALHNLEAELDARSNNPPPVQP
jgi:phage recombination protein Bet